MDPETVDPQTVRENAVGAMYFDNEGNVIAYEVLNQNYLSERQFATPLETLPHLAPCHPGEVPRRLPNGQLWCFAR